MPGWPAAWAIRRLSAASSAGCRCFSEAAAELGAAVAVVGAGRCATAGPEGDESGRSLTFPTFLIAPYKV
jgi:hypothetical protein